MQSWGIPADTIAKLSGISVPNDLYKEIADRAERQTKPAEVVLYDTTMHEETKNLYYDNHHLYKFEAKVQDIFLNVQDQNKRNIVILFESAFYPTSGG